MSMTHDEMIAVITAHKDGKIIQHLRKFDREGFDWEDCAYNKPCWSFEQSDYRIKPEPPKPREFWISPTTVEFGGPDDIMVNPPSKRHSASYIHVREVLP